MKEIPSGEEGEWAGAPIQRALRGGGELTIYDVSTDERRPATQEDIDGMQKFLLSLTRPPLPVNDDIPDDADFSFLLAMYPNRMRDDGVFVAELKEIEPYKGITGMQGEAIFPSHPDTPYRLGTQLPRKFAKELVRRWNAFSMKKCHEAIR